jgi:heme exporter protein D
MLISWASSKKIQVAAQKVLAGGAVSSFFQFWNGRTTFFAICFSVAGVYGWLALGRDLTSFALFAGAMQTLLTVKSGLQDYNDRQTQQQSTQVVNNITVDPNVSTPPTS